MTTRLPCKFTLPGLLLFFTVLAGFACKESRPRATQEKQLDGGLITKQAEAAASQLAYREDTGQRGNPAEVTAFGPVFRPTGGIERRLEYAVNLTYQITDLKSTRAFFHQWISRYGFLLGETASGLRGGYLSLQVKIRSAQLYQALSELDSIGTLASEQISVTDHTEAGVLHRLGAAREELRLRRRSAAAQQAGAQSKNWQAAESLLAASEDKDLQNRMEEWRINDRTAWTTVTIALEMPVAPQSTEVNMPHFRNAFVGVLNVLLQMLYLSIYLVPLGVTAWLLWRGFQKMRAV